MPRRQIIRAAGAVLGIALMGYLIRRAGLATLLESMHRLGWGLALIVAVGGLSHLVKSCAWRLTLAGCGSKVSLGRLLQLRLVSEAAGQVGALGQLFGEGVRVSALSSEIPIEKRVSSVALDRALLIITGAAVSIAGIVVALLVAPLSAALRMYAVLFAMTMAGLLCAGVVAAARRLPFLSASARALSQIGFFRSRLGSRLPIIRSVEDSLFDFRRNAPLAFWGSVVLNFLFHALAILEVYLILILLGTGTGLLGAVVFEGITKLVNAVGLFNPGNLGTYEGGNVLIARMFALPAFTGLTVAVARRARAIFWTAAGIICLAFISRKVRTHSEKTVEKSERETARTTAMIVLGGAALPMARVGTLPILLRTILGLKKAGAARVVVCADCDARRRVERELLEMGRLPHFVEWIEPGAAFSLARSLRQTLYDSRGHRLMVVDGTKVYHPALFRSACEWDQDEGGLLLTTAGEPIGVDVLSATFVREVAEFCPPVIRTLNDLRAWLRSSDAIECEEVGPEMWQAVDNEPGRIAAESKLNRWLVKPTDGNFARFNRRISVPISRQLIKLSITPNMVSIFTLGVGLAAGIMFARGGYWNMLAGAVLSVFASILDGCDGEVARLKLMESDFGCWLETVCDWLYYVFVFAGMTIGLARTLGARAAIVWGGLLLFGAVMSFLVTGLGRRKYASRRPEQYLAIWHANAEKRRSNPILYMGRNMEFMVRRCFMPYALLGFAVLNLLNVVFFLAAIGANIAWLVSLYSYGAFALGSRSEGPSLAPQSVAVTPAE
ncbi:MAG: flippase-like domain-containing protein [Silvibacterium sp.]|nr:flippase-like domain-containing protein [Silvibacterium sp.]